MTPRGSAHVAPVVGRTVGGGGVAVTGSPRGDLDDRDALALVVIALVIRTPRVEPSTSVADPEPEVVAEAA